MTPSSKRIGILAFLVPLMLGQTSRSFAGIITETSSNTSVATIVATPDYSGPNVNFVSSGSFSASVMSQSLLAAGTTRLSFSYEGLDYGNGVRPVLNVTNNTGASLISLTFALTSASESYYGFWTSGATSATNLGATVNMTTVTYFASNALSVNVPISLAPGASIGIYLPVNLPGNTRGSFSLDETVVLSSLASPEPSTITSLCLGVPALVVVLARRRRRT